MWTAVEIKLVLVEVDEELAQISDVDGAGDPLRGQAVIEVRGQPGGERYAGEQAKTKIDRVNPNDKRPVAQGKLKSLGEKVG